MIAVERFEEVRVAHKGNIQDDIIEGVYTVAEDFPRLIDASESMKAARLSEDEQRLLGEVSLVARYGDEESPLRPEQITEPRRREDMDRSLWTTFNVIQLCCARGWSKTRAYLVKPSRLRWSWRKAGGLGTGRYRKMGGFSCP